MVDHITNCPNCGGVLHDYICDYCGTVMPVNIDDFIGKRALLVSIDDTDGIIFSAIDVRRVDRNDNYGIFYTDHNVYNRILESSEIDITGYLTDSPTNMHELRKVRDILKNRLKSF